MTCKPLNRLLMLRAGGLSGPLFQGVALAAALQLLSGSNVGHIAGTRDADLFLAGHSSWVANPAGLVAQDCNAYPYGGGYS